MRSTGPAKAGHYAAAALVVFLTIGQLAAQQPPIVPPPLPPIPQPNQRGRTTQHKVVIRGCVRNGRLLRGDTLANDLTFDTFNVSEFILEGPKELLRQIQEQHNRHYDEIDGIAFVPPPPNDTDATAQTAKKGKVRIAAGRRDEKGLGGEGRGASAPQQIRLRVASLTHISEGCVGRQ